MQRLNRLTQTDVEPTFKAGDMYVEWLSRGSLSIVERGVFLEGKRYADFGFYFNEFGKHAPVHLLPPMIVFSSRRVQQ